MLVAIPCTILFLENTMSHFKNPIFVYTIIQIWQHGIFMHIYSHEYAIFVLFSQNSQGAKDIQEHWSASHTTSTLERSPLSRLQGFSVSRKTLLDGSTVTAGVSQFHSVDPKEKYGGKLSTLDLLYMILLRLNVLNIEAHSHKSVTAYHGDLQHLLQVKHSICRVLLYTGRVMFLLF